MNPIFNASINSSISKPIVFTPAEDIIIKIIYVLLSIIDIVGNTTVIYIIYKDKRIHNTVNLLILNLSLSDIIAGVGIFPYLFIDLSKETGNTTRANLLCGIKEGQILFLTATLVNFLTLGILSFSRYMLINHPTKIKWRIKSNQVKWFAIGTWITGLSVITPNVLSYRYISDVGLCEGYWRKGLSKAGFFVVTVLLALVPLLSLIFTYVSTIYTLWFKASTRRLTRSNSCSGVQSSRKKVTMLLGLLILAFFICWAPFAVFWIMATGLQYFPETTQGNIDKHRVIRYTILVAFVNTCLDPVIYAFGNRQIKEGARKTLRKGRTSHVEPTATAFE